MYTKARRLIRTSSVRAPSVLFLEDKLSYFPLIYAGVFKVVSVPQVFFLTRTLCAALLSPIRATLPTHLILLVLITEKYWDSTGLFKMIVGVLTTCHTQYT